MTEKEAWLQIDSLKKKEIKSVIKSAQTVEGSIDYLVEWGGYMGHLMINDKPNPIRLQYTKLRPTPAMQGS